MTKKSWIILGSTLGGVVVVTSVLVPVLLIPNIYKVNDIKSFVQKYTPVRTMDEYEKMEIDQTKVSGKLLFFSYIYTTAEPLEYHDIKTNGLHNSLSFTINVNDDVSIRVKMSYSNNDVTVKSSDGKNDLAVNEWIFTYANSMPMLIGPGISSLGYDATTLFCPIWGDDGNIDWDYTNY